MGEMTFAGLMVGTGILLAIAYENVSSVNTLKECAETNNVYRCEFKAVPVQEAKAQE